MNAAPTTWIARVLTAALAAAVGSIVASAAHAAFGEGAETHAATPVAWIACGAIIGLAVGICCANKTAFGGAARYVFGLAGFIAVGAGIGWGWAKVESPHAPRRDRRPGNGAKSQQAFDPIPGRFFPDNPLGDPRVPSAALRLGE